jgi:hypothetical protein
VRVELIRRALPELPADLSGDVAFAFVAAFAVALGEDTRAEDTLRLALRLERAPV